MFEVIEEKENPFLRRKELKLSLKHEGKATPSKSELIKALAERYSVDASKIVVDYIFAKKGIAEAIAKVKILEKGEKN